MIHDNLAVSASIVDIKGTKEEFSVLVSLSKLLLFLVADWLWCKGVLLLTKYVRNWRTR